MKTYSHQWLLTLISALALTPALAQAAADSTGTLQEIVVTAEKRPERLQGIPASVQVVSSNTLANMNAGDISDLNRAVPSVNMNGTINGRVPYGIRGVSSTSNEFTVGMPQGVAIMVDGVPLPDDARAGNVVADVTSVEVLEWPQGTLGGPAAATGVVNIVTRKPSDVFLGEFSATGTTDAEYRGNGFIAGPITQGVDYSLSANWTTRDFPIRNVQLGRRTTEHEYSIRGKLQFQPTDQLTGTVAASIGHDNSSGFNFVYTHLTPGIFLLTGAGGPPFMSQAALLPGITPSFDNQVYSSPVNAYSTVSDRDLSLDLKYRTGGGFTLGSTTAYMHEAQQNEQDLFAVAGYFWNELTGAGSGAPGTPPPFYNVQNQSNTISQISEELKLVSPSGGRFNYVAGIFYSDSKVDEITSRNLLPALQDEDVHPDRKTTDLYGRTTWEFSPRNYLSTGLRYNYDQISYVMNVQGYDVSFPPPNIYATTTPAAGSHNESTVVGDVSLKHKYSQDQMVYLSYTRGYSPSVFNTSQALTQQVPVLGLAKKEGINSFELGTKGSYLENRLTVNAALFYTQYQDFQVQIFDQSNVSINPPLILANAAAKTRGLNLDVAFAPTSLSRVSLNMAYTDATFGNYVAPCYYPSAPGIIPTGSSCYQANAAGAVLATAGQPAVSGVPVGQNLNGRPMSNAPKFKAVLDLQQTIPSGRYDWVLDGNLFYRDSAQMLVDQNPYAVQPSLYIVNLSVGVKVDKFLITAFMNNAFNQHYFTDLEDFWSGPWGGTNAVVGQPARDTNRYGGLRFTMKF